MFILVCRVLLDLENCLICFVFVVRFLVGKGGGGGSLLGLVFSG